MGRVEKIKSERVICDEIFHLSATTEQVAFRVPEGTNLGDEPTVFGTVTVGVLACDLDEDNGEITATVTLMVQEELLVTPGGDNAQGSPIELEYGFRVLRELTFQKCQLPEELTVEDVRCQVFRLDANGDITDIQPAAEPNTAVFDNMVSILVKIKVVEEIQSFVSTGTPPDVINGEVRTS